MLRRAHDKLLLEEILKSKNNSEKSTAQLLGKSKLHRPKAKRSRSP